MRLGKKVVVMGLGYIGLPTAALLANNGYQVHGVDLVKSVITSVNEGKIHFKEPGLAELLKEVVSSGYLHAASKAQKADIFIICVPTPFELNGVIPRPIVDHVISAVREIAKYLQPGNLVLLESTCPVGTTNKIAEVLSECGIDIENISLAYCPERVLPGSILDELINNDRVVGGINKNATSDASAFYKTFTRGKVTGTDAQTAEMCKLAENSFRDVNIAFANELSILCANLRINVWELINLANLHPRVRILQPGVGVGGHCIAVDPWFIIAKDPVNAALIRTARVINDGKTEWVISQIKAQLDRVRQVKKESIPVLACLGISFKPNVEDLRESPALKVATFFQNSGCELLVVEPNIENYDQFNIVSLENALMRADVVAVLVSHDEFNYLGKNFPGSKNKIIDFCGQT